MRSRSESGGGHMHIAVTVLYNVAVYGIVVAALVVLGAVMLWVFLKATWP